MSRPVSRGSAGEDKADEQAGVAQLSWRRQWNEILSSPIVHGLLNFQATTDCRVLNTSFIFFFPLTLVPILMLVLLLAVSLHQACILKFILLF